MNEIAGKLAKKRPISISKKVHTESKKSLAPKVFFPTSLALGLPLNNGSRVWQGTCEIMYQNYKRCFPLSLQLNGKKCTHTKFNIYIYIYNIYIYIYIYTTPHFQEIALPPQA